MKIPFLLLAFGLILGALCLSAERQRPNILFVIADDCTYEDLGTYGGQARTPNLDALAVEGLKFNKCFQVAPMCSPTRHNIYTGLYPVKSGAWPNHTNAYEDVRSIVHDLKPLGYRVALSGKTHIGPESVFPFEYSKAPKSKTESIIEFEAVEQLMKECSESGQPFALFACSDEPHTPWSKGVEYRDIYPKDEIQLRPFMVDTPETRENFRNYLAEITYFDSEVGRLLALLEKYGLAGKTLVMVVSEQGNAFPFAKWSCYDDGLRSAMVVRWPGKIEPGDESEAMVEYVDILPTFVEAAGGKLREELDGKSMVSLFAAPENEHKEYVYGLQTSRGINHGPVSYGIRSVRDKRYKLIWNLSHQEVFKCAMDPNKWFQSWEREADAGNSHAEAMLDRYHHRPEYELYDTKLDTYEIHNLADHPIYEQVKERLRKKLENWMESQGDKGQATEMSAFERMPKKKS